MSLEMAHKVILPPKKNYIPQFLKQRDINSYNTTALSGCFARLCDGKEEVFCLPMGITACFATARGGRG
jgi:hypothetical protein